VAQLVSVTRFIVAWLQSSEWMAVQWQCFRT